MTGGTSVRAGAPGAAAHPTSVAAAAASGRRDGPVLRLAGGHENEAEGAAASRHHAREHDLVERIRGGDKGAFDELVLAYYAELCAVTGALIRSDAAAEDLVQELFLKIWSSRETFSVQSSLRKYLFRAARNAVIDHHRRERMIRRWEEDVVRRDEAPAMGAPLCTDGPLEASEVQAAVGRAIEQLPARCRQVAILRLQHNLSRAEVAEAMGVTVKTVERQIARALRSLRESLAPYSER